MMQVFKYDRFLQTVWDEFVDCSKNGSFLFKRSFMDYHSDRFIDHSLLVYDDKQLIAILPANLSNNKIISHEGLSYGGIVLLDDLKFAKVIEVYKSVLKFLKSINIDTFIIKNIPRIYNSRPADELDWISYKVNAKIFRRDTAMVLSNESNEIPYQDRRKRAIKKASKENIDIKVGINELIPFWNDVLIPNLQSRHGVSPVHTLEEIQLLATRFPDNIRQHTIYLNNKIVAGCTMFLNKGVAHAQYISGTTSGRDSGCLDYLFNYLIKNIYINYTYFDFGICNEQNGKIINEGLMAWKEGFGARAVIHDFFEIDTPNYVMLESIYS
ncbi:MAG: GNAT family N-acetyltransferase [Sphingomonadales bacterium]|jgi:hypothetical protein